MPRQRCAPALPIERRLFSSLPTSPIVARHSTCDASNLAGTQTHLGVAAFPRQQLNRRAGCACQLGAFAGHHLDAVDSGTDRYVAQWQRIARLDRRL
jgi:hypothetical protein